MSQISPITIVERPPVRLISFFFDDTATTEIYTLSLHDRSSDLMGLRGLECARVGGPLGVCGFGVFYDASGSGGVRSEEHTSELQSRLHLVCRLLLEKKNHTTSTTSRAMSPARSTTCTLASTC